MEGLHQEYIAVAFVNETIKNQKTGEVTNAAQAVPRRWIIGDETLCFWPPENTPRSDIPTMIQTNAKPGEGWILLAIKVIGKAGEYCPNLNFVYHFM